MKFSKLILGLLVFSTLSACNNGGGGGTPATPKTPEEILQQEAEQLKKSAGTKDFSTMIKADRFDVQKTNLSFDEQKEMYQQGCKNPNQNSYEKKYELDPTLKVGAEFTREFAIEQVTRPHTWQKTTATVTFVDATKTTKESNFEFLNLGIEMPFTSPDEIFVSRPHSVETTTYTFKDGYPEASTQSQYNLTPAAQQWLSQNSKANEYGWYCNVRNQTAGESTVDKGVYLIMGRLVTSYRRTSSYKGTVFCTKYSTAEGSSGELPDNKKHEVEMGEGVMTSVKIVSNQVGSLSWTECGGNDLYYSSMTKLNSGKILSSWVEKFSKLPLK